MAHPDLLGRATGLRLSRVTLEGRLRWTIKEKPGEVALGYRSGSLVVIGVAGRFNAFRHDESYVLGLDADSGHVRWRTPL